ncbi:MAG: ATP-binding protein, partial [Candidatus Riflebacteria bacterium]
EILLLKAKEEAEAATKAKGYFLANMSHEIRTPMNAILGFTSLLSNTSMDEKQKEFLSIVQKSGKLLQEVINNILDLSKFETFQFSLEEIEFKISDLCSDAMKISQTRIEDKQIATSIEIGPRVPEVLIGDPTRIQQVLVNLLNNAIKFTKSGSIIVKVNLEQALPDQKVDLKFTVIDTGLGIPSDKIAMIFNPFTQIDETITRKYGGTGLGLSICKAIVEKYSGKIDVRSELNQGSEFIFNLVLRVKEQAEQSSSITEATNAIKEIQGKPRLKILVAEDEASNKKLMSEYLKVLGHDCVFAENGREAVEQTKNQKFSICFMDLQMPEMDGFTATEIIRRDISTDLPIIALSASVIQKDRENCTRVGMNGYLAKPVFIENLQSCIEQFCTNSSETHS